MKNSLTLFFIIFTLNVFAQTDSLRQTEQYFEFTAVKKGLFDNGYGFNISINFGQKYLSRDSLTRTTTINKIHDFSQIEDVLAFMNERGWKLVCAYTTSHDHFYTFYYLLRREL